MESFGFHIIDCWSGQILTEKQYSELGWSGFGCEYNQLSPELELGLIFAVIQSRNIVFKRAKLQTPTYNHD